MIADLSRAITAAMSRVQLSSTGTTAVRKKLIAALIDPLLLSMTLEEVRRLRNEGHDPILDEVLREMTLQQLSKASKAWNRHRKINKATIMRDLQLELRELLGESRQPALDPTSLFSKSLQDAQQLRERLGGLLVDEALRSMSLAQLRKVSSNWNSHRKYPRDAELVDIQRDLLDLVAGRQRPMSAPPSPPSRSPRRARPPHHIAAE